MNLCSSVRTTHFGFFQSPAVWFGMVGWMRAVGEGTCTLPSSQSSFLTKSSRPFSCGRCCTLCPGLGFMFSSSSFFSQSERKWLSLSSTDWTCSWSGVSWSMSHLFVFLVSALYREVTGPKWACFGNRILHINFPVGADLQRQMKRLHLTKMFRLAICLRLSTETEQ